MSAATLPSPRRTPVCLTRSDLSRAIKGGTIIAEEVKDLGDHRERILDPDGYRFFVLPCPRCGSGRVHAHSFRCRLLRPASPQSPARRVEIRLYRCAFSSCRAVFTVLPAFIARHLWRSWEIVSTVCCHGAEAPRTTRRRWVGRLLSDASQLLQLLFSVVVSGHPVSRALGRGRPRTRRDFLDALTHSLGLSIHSALVFSAAWIHRLQPGIRLM